MSLKLISSALLAATLSTAAFADQGAIKVTDSYARSATANAKTGAAYITLMNTTEQDDRLLSVSSSAAQRVELHTHKVDDGIARMLHVEEGFPIAAGDMIDMNRGGNHVMFMGLNGAFEQGALVPVTLSFEKAGDIEVMVPVDLERKPKEGHSGHDHSDQSGHDDHSGHADH
ncbi:MAG: copper chaperone PCu(A)C [Litoreibacter sp.]|uniref:copper chaperone PCu(A)C n=1 Tax=Litoreibacter sp. TaxID=1969459 RepID=UPI0032982C57